MTTTAPIAPPSVDADAQTPDLDPSPGSELAVAASPYVPVLAAQLMARRGCPWPVSGDASRIVTGIRTMRLDLGLEVHS